jgi:hypothetical protein
MWNRAKNQARTITHGPWRSTNQTTCLQAPQGFLNRSHKLGEFVFRAQDQIDSVVPGGITGHEVIKCHKGLLRASTRKEKLVCIMKFAQLIIGPAGSGKSTYCDTMQQHGKACRRMMHAMNLGTTLR